MLSADRSKAKATSRAGAQPEFALPVSQIVFVDPLIADAAIDPKFQLSDKQISRMITVATQTGARFHREGGQDPVEWMYQAHPLFSGKSALIACIEQDNYRRAMICHGLALSSRTTPEQVDTLLNPIPSRFVSGAALTGKVLRGRMCGRFLYTVSISDRGELGHYLVFLALIAGGEDEVMADLSDRFGARLAAQAKIRRGFDPSEPVAMALVSEAMAETLRLVSNAPGSSLANGIELRLEARSTH